MNKSQDCAGAAAAILGFADQEMKSDQEDDDDGSTTSTSSCYYSDHRAEDEDKGQEGDDEHSDWVSEDWMEDMESERTRDILIRKLRDYSSREMRAGKRRVYPNKPVFSIKTSANEKLSKFLQDPQQSQLRLAFHTHLTFFMFKKCALVARMASIWNLEVFDDLLHNT